jgi:hypothetical protein
LVTIPGKYNYDPGGWLNLKNVQSQVYKMALLRFHRYLFLVDSNTVKKFENEFEFAAGKFKYSSLKSFQPDPNLLKACAELSEKYFMRKIEDP